MLVAALSPVLAMSVSPTRNLLFGLAPEEAVLALADEIDKSRVETETKLLELENTVATQAQSLNAYELQIAEQSGRLLEQEKLLNSQQAQVSSQAQVQQSLNKQVETQANCQKLYSENIYCGGKTYKTKSAFDDHIEDLEDNDSDRIDTDKMVASAKAKYKKCQEIIQICGY